MLTNKQLIIIGAIAIALTALIMGFPLERVGAIMCQEKRNCRHRRRK